MSFQGPTIQTGNNGYLTIPIGNGFYIGTVNSGNHLSFFSTTASGTILEIAYFTSDYKLIFPGQYISGATNKSRGFEIHFDGSTTPAIAGNSIIAIDFVGNFTIGTARNFYIPAVGQYGSYTTSGVGVPPIYGLDNRTGVTAKDTSARTLWSHTQGTQSYLVAAHLNAISGTSISASYTISWTEGGAPQTNVLTVSSIAVPTNTTFLVQPTSGVSITGQLTAIAGTGTAVNISVAVLEIA